MKKLITVFLMIINCMIFNAFADSIVHEIYCDGLQRISLDTILLNLPIKIGDFVNSDSIADCIKILFSSGYFEEVLISHDNGIMLITVKERPIINTIKMYKNQTIKSEMVQQILDSKNIKVGYPLSDNSIFEAQQELENICYNFGKFDAIVQIVKIPLTRNRLDLQVIFSEGKFTKVNHFNIIGNQLFSEKQLLKKLTLYQPVIWKNMKLKKIYQKQKLLFDLEKLRDFYLNQGYAKFHIDDIRIQLTPNKKNVDLAIYITEGNQYFLKSLVICGNILSRVPEIKEYFQIQSIELYNHKKIKEIERNIHTFLGKIGYIQPKIFIEYIFDDYHKIVTLYVYIDAGHRYYVREIRFEGNDITQDSVIRREIRQSEQAPLNYLNVIKDQKRLQRFNYFKSIDTRIEFLPNLPNQIDLIYKIVERNTGNLNLSIGFGTESGLNMQVSMNQENVLGTGNAISITTTKNRHQTYFDALILKKYFGIKDINISGNVFYNNFVRNKINLSNYNIKNYGFGMHYVYPYTIYTSYDIGLNYVSNHLSHIEPQVAIWRYLYSIGINPNLINKNKKLNSNIDFCTNDFLMILMWNFNNLNRSYFPESGSHISVTNNITLPGSDNKYYKIIIDINHYLSLDKYAKWVLMNNMYIGYSRGLYKAKESPFYDNFHIGGIGTVRGFQLNSIGPKAAYYICNDSDVNYSTCRIENSIDAVGGNATILIKGELIVPIISFINKSEYFDTMRIALFIDSGTIWDTYWRDTEMTRSAGIINYSIFGHIRLSSGISLKWMSPIGPIIFSYAKLFKKYPGDTAEPLQFSIGKSW